jgi:hypothetical protein
MHVPVTVTVTVTVTVAAIAAQAQVKFFTASDSGVSESESLAPPVLASYE